MVAVIGGSGRAGGYVCRELLEHGHAVRNIDLHPPTEGSSGAFYRVDATDVGQVVAALEGAEAVVHLAAIIHPNSDPPHVVFGTNVMSTWHVLQAAELLQIPKLVLASSINAMGMSFSRKNVPPLYLPVDEQHPTRAEDSYSLSKWVGEQIADGFARRRPVQIASFRFHGLWDTREGRGARRAPPDDPVPGSKHLWGYTDLSDAARACRLALAADWQGHEVFFITAADTYLTVPTRDAADRALPGVPLRAELAEFASAFDCSKAERFFGWRAERSWRDAG